MKNMRECNHGSNLVIITTLERLDVIPLLSHEDRCLILCDRFKYRLASSSLFKFSKKT